MVVSINVAGATLTDELFWQTIYRLLMSLAAAVKRKHLHGDHVGGGVASVCVVIKHQDSDNIYDIVNKR